ncbi:hypothetical protein [Exiguobacterium oxidotolerans]|uniref:Immunity protein 30 domain-containing protein n=1 Tax=Exiguobacterium oxidotolerans TaxID=223958 RepID=A0A653I2J9_9BACL|nr:hypothetical protein [Exiguobacterium oxidotolerans]VWX33013.1 conserved hypothetical protein [Exiguobacterium oxidotolerans]
MSMEHTYLMTLIEMNRYAKAKTLFETYDIHEITEELIGDAFDHETDILYQFVCYLIEQKETVKLHELAFGLLMHPFCHYDRAYYLAYDHVQRTVALTHRQDVAFLEYLLFLAEVPDQVTPKQEALAVANEILWMEPKNQIAKDFLKEMN